MIRPPFLGNDFLLLPILSNPPPNLDLSSLNKCRPCEVNMLCSRCTHYHRDLPYDKPYHISYELGPMKEETRKWCDMCALLWNSLSSFLGDDVNSLYRYLAFSNAHGDVFDQSRHKRPMRADLRSGEMQSDARTIRLQFYVDSTPPTPFYNN